MLKAIKYLTVFSMLILTSVISCDENTKTLESPKTECNQIKDVITDCLGLHRGALRYIDNCGNISIDVIESLNSCEEKLDYINIKD